MNDIKIQGPVEIELKVHITDGEMAGVATIGMGIGKYPTPEQLRERVAKFAAEEMHEGFRLMDKREYWDYVCREQFGVRFTLPGGEDFDQ
jgi:hypothetical protein